MKIIPGPKDICCFKSGDILQRTKSVKTDISFIYNSNTAIRFKRVIDNNTFYDIVVIIGGSIDKIYENNWFNNIGEKEWLKNWIKIK